LYPINVKKGLLVPIVTPSQAIIAVDIGTGSSRALLVDSTLNLLSTAQVDLHIFQPASGWAEQDPDEVCNATFQVIQQAAAAASKRGIKVTGICFSSAVSSLIALDENFTPLTNSITWADSRSKNQAGKLRGQAEVLYQRTGVPLHAAYWLPKLLWLQENQPEIFEKTSHWSGQKEMVVYRMTGEFCMDQTLAAATGMLNVDALQWDDLACSLAGVSPDRLPEIRPTTTVIPKMNPEMSASLGLPNDVPVILGSGDGMLANLGSGVFKPGQVATTVGSSGACRTMSALPVIDKAMRTWSYPLIEGLWVIGGANNSGGLVLDWFQKEFLPQFKPSDRSWMQTVEQTPVGSNGLIFLPYLFGERAPIWNEAARGAFLGLESRHTLADLSRSVLEGTIFALFDIYRAVVSEVTSCADVHVSGGYTQSEPWLAIQANMFGKDLVIVKNHECSALGAAVLGLMALGHFPDLEHAMKFIQEEKIIHPNAGQMQRYQEVIALYDESYRQLTPVFDSLERFRSSGGTVHEVTP